MLLVSSRYPLVSATAFGSGRKAHHLMAAHLLPKLRCQFAEFLNQSSLKRLGMLSLPTCVGLRYGRPLFSTRGFSWKHGVSQLGFRKSVHLSSPLGVLMMSRLSQTGPRTSSYRFEPHKSICGLTYPSPSPLASTNHGRCRNINLLSISYAFRPRLRIRLTLGGLTLPRKP